MLKTVVIVERKSAVPLFHKSHLQIQINCHNFTVTKWIGNINDWPILARLCRNTGKTISTFPVIGSTSTSTSRQVAHALTWQNGSSDAQIRRGPELCKHKKCSEKKSTTAMLKTVATVKRMSAVPLFHKSQTLKKSWIVIRLHLAAQCKQVSQKNQETEFRSHLD